MAWDQDAMSTVFLVAAAPFLLAMVLEAVRRRRSGRVGLAGVGLVLAAYPYNAQWTVAHLCAVIVLAVGSLTYLWDVLIGRTSRPGRAPKRYVLQKAQDPPPPRPPWPAHRG